MRFWSRHREEPAFQPASVGLEPLEAPISAFWETLTGSTLVYTPALVERVWAANRCVHLSANQISSMPLRYTGIRQPQWVTNPDPLWYPGGIRETLYKGLHDMYVYGDAFLYITTRYADGFPATFTMLDAETMDVRAEDGERTYRSGQRQLDPENVVQISRDPRGGVRGTPALKAYAGALWGLVAAGELAQSMVGTGGSVPNTVLKSTRKLGEGQARALQEQWVAARQRSGVGVPAVLGPDLQLEQLSFSPDDMLLVEVQQYGARVVASAFGVPPFMLNVPLEGGLTYQNPAMLIEQWWRSELRPMAGHIADVLSAELLPRGSAVEFDSQEALAPPQEERIASGLAMLGAGAISVNEFRAAILHLPPLEAGDAIDELVKPAIAAASPNPPANVAELRPAEVS